MPNSKKPGLRKTLSVGEVAKRSGVAISALHFYEAKGLIKGQRNAGNHRRYSRDVLRRVAIIKVAQRAGLPLKDIANALNTLPEKRTPNFRDWAKLSSKWKVDLDERIAQLIKLRDQLTECIGCGCLSINDCPLRNPNDSLGEQGPGARLMDISCNQTKQHTLVRNKK